MHLEAVPVATELEESGPLAAVELVAAALELGHRDTAGVGLDRAGLARCRADSDLEAFVLEGSRELRTANNPSVEEGRSQVLDIDRLAELVDRGIAHTEVRSSDSEARELGKGLAVLDTVGLVEVGRTSEGSLADRAGFAEDTRGSVDKLFVDTAVAVMENFVAVAVLDWEPEKLVEPGPMQTHWEFELCRADRELVEID